MRRRTWLLWAAAAVCVGTHGLGWGAAGHFCGARQAHPIDQQLAAAAQRSGGVTVDLLDAQNQALAAWDRELNRIYAALVKELPHTERDVLRKAQRAWLAYDRAQAQWDAALHAGEGSAAALNTGGAALQRLRDRTCTLMNDAASARQD